ncbi:Nif3-like dinuclear metal center hexameric protein [Romeria aff. gracilis LEGE 07310]|uniref:GTP cyclohydrolase 1 type 2 homolog n=1 Tax=Vasconcelosia minhoensis LEGE 07310 TaxID=915328 RepID=A0A8J7A7G4_9CYAN|nr:Nif3-like dinuclear metal center hexameric protein [Romeria gracilis]MBE9078317.1 Nif3-like dinuclear metal center hexameric protein [Romeria aff. gracilis LEGE 07310]
MTIAELIASFEVWAHPDWQEKWDNCGWQIEPGILDQLPGVLVCLTPTLAVMAEAIQLKQQGHPVNLIFAHHPLIFHPLKSVTAGDPVGDMVRLGLTHGIGVYSAHTNFDQVADGTADVLAQLLQLQQPEPVVPTETGRGYGRVGDLPNPCSLRQLLSQIQAKLEPPTLLYSPTANLQQTIRRVAVLGGSGASFLSAVSTTGAQVYLTSDCKFHQFQEGRDRGLILVDAGHYATERPACARLTDWLRQQGASWVRLSDRDEDFRQYFR